jgi:hypothetical protein
MPAHAPAMAQYTGCRARRELVSSQYPNGIANATSPGQAFVIIASPVASPTKAISHGRCPASHTRIIAAAIQNVSGRSSMPTRTWLRKLKLWLYAL